jgi:hypothetical protein
MNKLLILGICLAALAGCNGKQQKLEECMAAAASKFDYVVNESVNDSGQRICPVDRKFSNQYGDALCESVKAISKQQRLEEEDRCVKLYK